MNTIIQRLGLLVAMCFTILPIFAYDFEVDGIYYNLISASERTCEVTYGDNPYKGVVNITPIINYKGKEMTVVSIGEKAFAEDDGLKNVTIPNTIETIGSNAFQNCEALLSIDIPESVTRLSTWTFSGCSNLTKVGLPNSVLEIGAGCFSGCTNLDSVFLPNSITKINHTTFKNCLKLKSISLPNTIISIAFEAFYNCKSLETIQLPNSLLEIDYRAFSYCSSLTSINLPEKVKHLADETFEYCSSLLSVILPDGIGKISYCCFYGCTSLQNISLPQNLKSIGQYAFYDCYSLKEITIPSTVEQIGRQAFCNCIGLHALRFDSAGNPLKLQVIFPKFEEVFSGCTSLSTLTTGRNVSVVDGYDQPKTVEKSGLTCLKTLKFLPGAYNLKSYSFPFWLSQIENLTLPEGLDCVGMNFSQYDNIIYITVESPTPPVCPTFSNTQYLNTTLYVPEEALDAYSNADGWKNFFTIEAMDSVEDIQWSSERYIVKRYNLQGNEVDSAHKGIVIVKYSDGTTKKIVQK